MKEWADVYLLSLDDRLAVQRFALFYIPRALELMSQNEITRNKLSNFATFHKGEKSVGKQAITKISDCKPAVYDSVTGFITLFNAYCAHEKLDIKLSTTDIVACVFRFESLSTLLNQIGLSQQALEQETGVAGPIIEAAIGGFRLQLVDCLKIWNVISRSVKFSSASLDSYIVASQRNSRNSIKKIKDDNYVYRREYLQKAPENGHPWSLK